MEKTAFLTSAIGSPQAQLVARIGSRQWIMIALATESIIDPASNCFEFVCLEYMGN
jgi:hypothetical protein